MRFRAPNAGYFKGFGIAALFLCAPALAASPEAEIDHLLGFIAASPCSFIRNGVAHDGVEAAAHIEDKSDHYRHDIRSAEDFIALAATRSALSGKPYLVTCGETAEPAADWIARELGAYRRNSGS